MNGLDPCAVPSVRYRSLTNEQCTQVFSGVIPHGFALVTDVQTLRNGHGIDKFIRMYTNACCLILSSYPWI